MFQFLHLLGVPSKWNIVDVYGLDGDALAWVPRPVLALILLFPCSEQVKNTCQISIVTITCFLSQFYKHAEEECAKLKQEGQLLAPELFYMKQYVSNACGTIALIHCVANNMEK